ncbi:hypothetical protein BC940DRAFT_314212 [Gongronella butleri]|nr:hypothetical protein BC940DRAFT_314212 [Gongronella butleri]
MSDTPRWGEEVWKQERQAWTATAPEGRTAARPAPLSDDVKDALYKAHVKERQAFRQPLPLNQAIPILIHGWKKDGLWPSDDAMAMLPKDESTQWAAPSSN